MKHRLIKASYDDLIISDKFNDLVGMFKLVYGTTLTTKAVMYSIINTVVSNSAYDLYKKCLAVLGLKFYDSYDAKDLAAAKKLYADANGATWEETEEYFQANVDEETVIYEKLDTHEYADFDECEPWIDHVEILHGDITPDETDKMLHIVLNSPLRNVFVKSLIDEI